MYGHTIAALCTSGDLILSDCMDHNNVKKLKLPDVDHGQVTKMSIFKNKPADNTLYIALV